jgi:hypothetical protein
MPIWPGPKVYLTRMPDGPRWYDGQLSTVSNVQENKGTAEASKKGKEGGKEGKEGRQKGRYVECSVEVSICHVDATRPPTRRRRLDLIVGPSLPAVLVVRGSQRRVLRCQRRERLCGVVRLLRKRAGAAHRRQPDDQRRSSPDRRQCR